MVECRMDNTPVERQQSKELKLRTSGRVMVDAGGGDGGGGECMVNGGKQWCYLEQ